MWVLILEALLAGGLFVFIIWWTMFSGRRQGERQAQPPLPGSAPGTKHPGDKPQDKPH